MPADPDEGRNILLRWRRIHQQGRGRPAGQAEITPERGVGGERGQPGIPPGRAGEEGKPRPFPRVGLSLRGRHLRQSVEQRFQPFRFARAVFDRRRVAQQRIAGMLQADLEPPRRQQGAGAFRPFDHADAVGERLLEADLPQFVRCNDPVQVDMPDAVAAEIVLLDQGEGRARHLFGHRAALHGKAADEMPGEGRLARAERPAQRDNVAPFRATCQRSGQRLKILFGDRGSAGQNRIGRSAIIRVRGGCYGTGRAERKPVIDHGIDAYWTLRPLSSRRLPGSRRTGPIRRTIPCSSRRRERRSARSADG